MSLVVGMEIFTPRISSRGIFLFIFLPALENNAFSELRCNAIVREQIERFGALQFLILCAVTSASRAVGQRWVVDKARSLVNGLKALALDRGKPGRW